MIELINTSNNLKKNMYKTKLRKLKIGSLNTLLNITLSAQRNHNKFCTFILVLSLFLLCFYLLPFFIKIHRYLVANYDCLFNLKAPSRSFSTRMRITSKVQDSLTWNLKGFRRRKVSNYCVNIKSQQLVFLILWFRSCMAGFGALN